jgi:hypothetical protein
LRELRGHRIRHRTRRNRREVTVPYRVLLDSEVSGTLGCPFPVRSWRSLNARSFRYFFLRPRPRMRLLGQSSPGVRPFYTVCPEVSATGLSTGGTSLGVRTPLQRTGRRESTSDFRRLPGFAGSLSTGPTPQTTVPLAGFLNLSAAFILSPPPHHFQVGGVHGVCPPGGCSFHEAPPARRRTAYPLDVAPAG